MIPWYLHPFTVFAALVVIVFIVIEIMSLLNTRAEKQEPLLKDIAIHIKEITFKCGCNKYFAIMHVHPDKPWIRKSYKLYNPDKLTEHSKGLIICSVDEAKYLSENQFIFETFDEAFKQAYEVKQLHHNKRLANWCNQVVSIKTIS